MLCNVKTISLNANRVASVHHDSAGSGLSHSAYFGHFLALRDTLLYSRTVVDLHLHNLSIGSLCSLVRHVCHVQVKILCAGSFFLVAKTQTILLSIERNGKIDQSQERPK